MVNGIEFVESILIWMGITFIIIAFVCACTESRESDDIDLARSQISKKLEHLGHAPWNSMMVLSLRVFRDTIDRAVSDLLIDFDISPFAASVVMAILSVFLPFAAAVNAYFGGSPFLFSVYAFIVVAIFVMGMKQSVRGSSVILGSISLLATFGWLVFGPLYAVRSLTDHIFSGTFSHAVLGSILVASILYAGCAGIWMLYRSIRSSNRLSHVDKFLARFLFAVPFMYILYWFGLLAGHFAVNDPSPERGWSELFAVVAVGAFSFAAIMASVEWGVREKRRGHGLAVIMSGLVLSLAGAVATHGLTVQGLPFWLKLWKPGFTVQDIILGSAFWTSHAPFFVWALMMSMVLFTVMSRVVLLVWPAGRSVGVQKPFLVLSGALVACAIVLFAASVIVDVYVNVN